MEILVGIGIIFLAASLWPIRQIILLVRGGSLRRQWIALCVLIVGFIVGYAGFLVVRPTADPSLALTIVELILFGGSVFVVIITRLSLTTTTDVVRIASLERDALIDPLTGVFNRRYLTMKLDEEVVRARREGHPLATLMLDIDHFKHVNDVYGHAIGDLVLRHVSSLLVQNARLSDTVIRYGGEEFLVIAPNSSEDDASALGNRLIEEIANSPVQLPEGETLFVTASCGTAALPTQGSAETMLKDADHALYRAKREGRNRLQAASQLS